MERGGRCLGTWPFPGDSDTVARRKPQEAITPHKGEKIYLASSSEEHGISWQGSYGSSLVYGLTWKEGGQCWGLAAFLFLLIVISLGSQPMDWWHLYSR